MALTYGRGGLVHVAVPQWRDVCCTALPVRALGRHRLTAADYRRLRATQDGQCGICRRANFRGDGPAPLYIDHDHACCQDHHKTCGRCVRGLLCSSCNGWLGELELWARLPGLEDYDWWEPAARAYLARAGCDPGDPARVAALARRHRERRARLGLPCSCQHCGPDGIRT
ncbi:endonuclease domain-containing protein [Micromonospora aurantiaca (nom. illeg.)]|uniref:endonuclease domain-containing protein n=1 Tax=Micromonospora aurantiaca (nom. illeg.) TaxID=47850 RepID=UPI00119E487D|nr:hypothetical protein [Micromonospora aurantiaca]